MSLEFDWPTITVDPDAKREWIHPSPPLYYLYEDEEGMWVVIDRSFDIAITKKHNLINDCIREFIARAGRGEIK